MGLVDIPKRKINRLWIDQYSKELIIELKKYHSVIRIKVSTQEIEKLKKVKIMGGVKVTGKRPLPNGAGRS